MTPKSPILKRVASPNAGVSERSPDIEARLMNAVLRLAGESPGTGAKYPLFSIHPDFPVVVKGAEIVLSSITNLTSVSLGAVEIGFFDYVFLRDNSGVTTQPQTKWLDHTKEAKSLAGTSFKYLEELTDAIYIGMADKTFNGLRFDVDTAGATSSGNVVVDAEYWDGSAWTDLTESDGTSSSSKHMAKDGTMTFTMPSDWVAAKLRDTFASSTNEYSELAPSSGEGIGGCASEFNKLAYWIRIKITTTAYGTVPTIKSIKRITDLEDYIAAAVKCSDTVTVNEPYKFTLNSKHVGQAGYDNKDGVAVGGALGAFIYANLIGSGAVTANAAVGLVVREDLMVDNDRSYGVKPTSQPFKTLGW